MVHFHLRSTAGWIMFMCFLNCPLPWQYLIRCRMLKATSSKWINDNNLLKRKFGWQACLPKGSSARRQEGYGGFSYSHSHIGAVINYIINQEMHHQKRTFRQEYHELLKKFEIPFEEKYLFNFME